MATLSSWHFMICNKPYGRLTGLLRGRKHVWSDKVRRSKS